MIFPIIIVFLAALHGSCRAEEHKPQPYSFGYTIKDKEGIQHRNEESDGSGNVKGNYGFIDNKGIHRLVNYKADHGGFRAQIKTNEPGTTGDSPASVKMMSNDPYAHGAARLYNSKVDVPYVSALEESDGLTGFPTVKDFHKYTLDSHDDSDKPPNVPVVHSKTGNGIVYFGANLVGGKITGHDSRFSRR